MMMCMSSLERKREKTRHGHEGPKCRDEGVSVLKTVERDRDAYFTKYATAENPAGARTSGPSRVREAGQHVEAAGHTCMESARSTLVVPSGPITLSKGINNPLLSA